jgi:ubiquitin C-terminal hydrolase
MGFEQHDTHEFLNFFLDKLNDDLNRVTEKPSNILSNKEENEPDIILKSDIYWKYFEMRNQSIVTDLFYGQFMSTIKCPICNTCSINFDPFLTLNFPIPKLNQEPEFNFECYFIFFNLKNYPLKINITINRTIRIFQLRKFLAKILKLNPLSFYMYYIGNGIIAKILSCSDIINCENAKKKIFMMQIDPRIFDNNSNRKYYDLLSITKQIKNGNFINIKTKLEYFTMNLLLQEKNDKFLECSNKNSNNFDDNNKEFEYLVKNIYDQPNNSNQILKEILKEYEETVDEELNHCPTSKTIGKYSNPFNPEFETSIDYLFEILIERIFKEEFNLFLLLKDKLKEFIIKDKKSIIKKNDQQKSIIFHDIENNNDSSVSTEEKYFVEKKIIKDLVNKIKDIDINEKINALNYFNFLLEREQEFEKLAYASDENNYLEDNFLKSIMDFCSIEEEKYNSYDRKSFSSNKSNAFSSKKKNFISPAVILTIDKQWNLEYLNEYIYNFLKNLVEKDRKYENLAKKFLLFDYNCYKTLNNKKELFATNQIPFIILIKPVFITKKVKVIKNANSQINLDNNHQEKNSEFTVQSTLKEGFKPILHSIYYDEEKDNFQNAGQNSNNGELQDKIETSNNEKIEDILEEKEIQICLFCEKEDCDGCILHAENSIRVSDLLLKYKDHNINLELKNEFLYLDDYLQNSTNNKLKKSLDFRLELVIQSEFIDCINSIRSVDSKNLKFHAILVKEHNLINSFENFKRVEKLEKTDEWKCPKCNDFRQANKKLEIYKAPKILIIHLNRFSYFDNRKINTEINFPIESLILDKYVVKKERSRKSIINDEDNKEFKFENVYDLFAIANHYGSLDGGHYIAVAKNPENSEWFQFNDSNVSRIKEINKSSAYLLFYRKRSFDDS